MASGRLLDVTRNINGRGGPAGNYDGYMYDFLVCNYRPRKLPLHERDVGRAYKDLDECAIFRWGNPSHCAGAERYLLHFLQEWPQKKVLRLWKDRERKKKKKIISDRENIRLWEDVQGNYGLLTQSLKTGSVVLKKRGVDENSCITISECCWWARRAVSTVQKCWKDIQVAVKNKPKAMCEFLVVHNLPFLLPPTRLPRPSSWCIWIQK